MIYLDNAATSYPKPKGVIKEVKKCLEEYCGNPGRSGHFLSMKAAEKVFETREVLSSFLGLSNPEKICFTQNATMALNYAIKGVIREKCHCIISDIEHNSVLRPLYKLQGSLGIDISVFNTDLPLSEGLEPLIKKDSRFLIINLASNVTGKVIDIKAVCDVAKKHNLTVIADASQLAGHKCIDLGKFPVDILCCAGHKALFGIQGSGFIVFCNEMHADTIIEGGSGSDTFNKQMPKNIPERFEAGTLSTPAIVSLCEGVQFIKSISVEAVEEKLDFLSIKMADMLSSIPDVKLYGCENGIALFNVKNYTSSQVSDYLSSAGIAVRGGLHCAPIIHSKLGTDNLGAVRASLSYFNTAKELNTLYKAIIQL